MCSLAFAVQPLGVEFLVDQGCRCAFLIAGEQCRKSLRIAAPAFETGSVTSGKGRDLVEEEQFRIAVSPDTAMPALEFEPAADPRARDPSPVGQLASRIVQAAATIAHQRSARRGRKQFAEGRDAILKRHAFSNAVMP